MSTNSTEELRELIWDFVFQNGQQSFADLSSKFEVTEQQLTECVSHEWFVVENEQVSIAQNSE